MSKSKQASMFYSVYLVIHLSWLEDETPSTYFFPSHLLPRTFYSDMLLLYFSVQDVFPSMIVL